jgi:hypothetical protein
MYFDTKNYLKSNRNHTAKQTLSGHKVNHYDCSPGVESSWFVGLSPLQFDYDLLVIGL